MHEDRPQEDVTPLKFRRKKILEIEKRTIGRDELERRRVAPAFEWRQTPDRKLKLQWRDVLWAPVNVFLWLSNKLLWVFLHGLGGGVIERGRWPPAKKRGLRSLTGIIDNSLRIFSGPLTGLLALMGFYIGLYVLVLNAIPGMHAGNDFVGFNVFTLIYFVYVFPLAGLVLTLLLLLLTNSVLAASSRRLL